MEEAAARFGGFQDSDRRPLLWRRFIEFVQEARGCQLLEAVLVDGSFVTSIADPNDIDLILVVSSNHDFGAEFQPSEYNILSKSRVHRRFGFEILVARTNSEEYRRYVSFFQQVRLEPDCKNGILRVWL